MDHLIAGWVGGASGVLASQPLDTIRVRMQTSSSFLAPSWISVLKSAVSNEGFLSLVKGVYSPMLSVGCWKATVFYTYEGALSLLHESRDKPAPLSKIFLAAFAGGMVGTPFVTASDLVKTRTQVDRRPQTVALWRRELGVAKEIVQTKGFRGMFRGFGITLCESPSMGVWFACNEGLLRLASANGVNRDNMLVLMTAGGISGSLSWVAIYPIDVVKSMYQTNRTDMSYREMLQTRAKETGSYAFLTRGLGATVFRGLPQCAVTMMMYAQAKKFLSSVRSKDSVEVLQ
jgi:solute carrier family 25 carnitine/acylcarnitine transporter 20/29